MNLRWNFGWNDFASKVTTVAIGVVLSQLIPFVLLPVLQRYYYAPEDFGLLVLYVSLSDLVIAVSTLKYEYAIVNVKKVADAFNLLILSLFSVFTFTFLTVVALLILFLFFPDLILIDRMGGWAFLLPVSVFSLGIFQAINYWFNRRESYKFMSVTRVVNTSFGEVGKLGLGVLNFFPGLVVGRVFGNIASAFIGVLKVYKSDRRFSRLYSFKRVKKLAITHKRYPLYVVPSVFVGVLVAFSYVRLLLAYYGEDKLGLLGVSLIYLGSAFGIISTSFGQVFFKKISDISDYRQLYALYKKFARQLFLFSLLVLLVVYIFPQNWVVIILGEKWTAVLPVCKIMVIWMSVYFVSSSLSFIYIKLEMQRIMFFLDVIHLALVLFSIVFAHYLYADFYVTLWWFCIAQLLHYTLAIFLALRYLKKKDLG